MMMYIYIWRLHEWTVSCGYLFVHVIITQCYYPEQLSMAIKVATSTKQESWNGDHEFFILENTK